jgi:hypothetical protein
VMPDPPPEREAEEFEETLLHHYGVFTAPRCR